ncbi:DNA polymerase alpha/epsilon subunit B-domain-containing protein [Hysterangium stoloniferum]|nr:DNA polymerase alpha/epsilon subunit B-domain-containing protein [Hysterangium stoloniferum]
MPLTRPVSVVSPLPETLPSFILGPANRSYKHQYANIYFIRLRRLRQYVENNARERWQNVKGNPQMAKRVLDVTKGDLCWIVGTVYMDMPLKPNILEDIGKDFSIPPPPPPPKYNSEEDSVVLEDESGRISLVGDRLKRDQFVTGIIMAALGIETPDGEFEVIDVCFPGMAPQACVSQLTKSEEDMDIDSLVPGAPNSEDAGYSGSWIALLSGLELSTSHPMSSETELHLQLLIEHILAESGGSTDQQLSSQISRVIIVGNSMLVDEDHSKSRRNNSTTTDPGPSASPAISTLSKALQEIALAVPIHILPGASDPSGVILPQQPMPRAMFGDVRKYESFKCETNPTWLTIDGQTLLLTSGQTLDDIYKYLDTNDRLAIATRTLEWRHMAPTAPDTLWCHPYSTQDPFILSSTPHIYIIGNQPFFSTTLVTSPTPVTDGSGASKKRDHEGHATGPQIKCRVVLLPKFSELPTLVLVHTGTLECKTIQVGVDVALLPNK